MVRLKVEENSFPIARLVCFNSTMVRLKVAMPTPVFEFREEFQFHYGTIKSPIPGAVTNNSPCFNSTMVRLKAEDYRMLRSIAKFQFHYGTIKRRCGAWIPESCIRFNSTMVRLKVFQGCHKTASVSHVSIPLWYD